MWLIWEDRMWLPLVRWMQIKHYFPQNVWMTHYFLSRSIIRLSSQETLLTVKKMHRQTKRRPFRDISKQWNSKDLLCDSCTQSNCERNFSLSKQHSMSQQTRSSLPWLHASFPIFFFLGQPKSTDKMDAGVTALAGVTDGPIIRTHPSGRRKIQHIACKLIAFICLHLMDSWCLFVKRAALYEQIPLQSWPPFWQFVPSQKPAMPVFLQPKQTKTVNHLVETSC